MMIRLSTSFGRSVILCVLLGASLSASAQPPSKRILGVEVQGNVRSDESLVVSTSGLTVGAELTGDLEQSAIRRLHALGVFSDVALWITDTTEEGVWIRVWVTEFPTLHKAAFEGAHAFKVSELEEELGLIEGQVVSPRIVKGCINRVRSMYEKKGYMLAEVDAETAEAAGTGQAAGAVTLTFRINEGKKVAVKRIEILGNSALDDAKIKKQMGTKEDRWWRSGDFKRETYREDLVKIISLYKQQGYREAEIARDTLYYDDSRRQLFIQITVDEGIRYRFGTVTWEGNTVLSAQELAEKVTFREGEVYDEEEFNRTHFNLAAAHNERGYLSARVVPVESLLGDRVNLHFRIVEGELSKVREVVIKGNTRTKEKVIRRELSVKPGQVFKLSDLQRSQRDVYMLNYFGNVEFDYDLLDAGDVDLTFKVEEKSTGTASIGASYSEQDKIVGTIGLANSNLFGNGQTLDFNWDFGTRRKTFQIGFTEPWFLEKPVHASFSLYSTTYDWSSSFDERRRGGYVRFGRRLKWPDRYSRVYLTYRLEQVEYFGFDASYTGSLRWVDWNESKPDSAKTLREWPEMNSDLEFRYVRDSRDMPEFASSGSIFSYETEVAGGFLGGDVDYHKHLLVSEFYFPMPYKTALAIHVSAGYVSNFSPSKDVPFSERFTPGGVSLDGQVRGYGDRSIGPSENGTILGGRTMLTYNIEYQIPIVRQQVYGLVFADAGNAWEWARETDPFDLKRSVGIGGRVVAPQIGIIGADLAYGFDHFRDGRRYGKWRAHFQFGRTFY